MTIFFILVFGTYFLFLLALFFGWERSLSQNQNGATDHQSIAVIIPFRNEAKSIVDLLKSLSKIDYPKEKVQIIFVDDHSTDESVELINNSGLPSVLILSLPQDFKGKKKAISYGIQSSRADIIVTTDADCEVSPQWLISINDHFQTRNLQLLVGAVAMRKTKSFFGKLQAIEFASLIGSGVSLLQWGFPAMANGANLAFRKTVFHDVNGYEGNEHIASGDDEYLLRKVFEKYPNGVLFNNNAASVVETKPQSDLGTFMTQRLRWAGKWKYQTNSRLAWIGAMVFLFQCIFAVACLYFVISVNRELGYLILAKMGIEGIFLGRVCQFTRSPFNLLAFIALQLVYPFYVIGVAISSQFVSVQWKGRKT